MQFFQFKKLFIALFHHICNRLKKITHYSYSCHMSVRHRTHYFQCFRSGFCRTPNPSALYPWCQIFCENVLQNIHLNIFQPLRTNELPLFDKYREHLWLFNHTKCEGWGSDICSFCWIFGGLDKCFLFFLRLSWAFGFKMSY